MGTGDSFSILRGQIGDQYATSNVVEQTGGEGFFDNFLALALKLRDALRGSGGGEAVMINLFHLELAALGGFKFGEKVDAKHQRLDGFHPKMHDGFGRIVEFVREAEEG